MQFLLLNFLRLMCATAQNRLSRTLIINAVMFRAANCAEHALPSDKRSVEYIDFFLDHMKKANK